MRLTINGEDQQHPDATSVEGLITSLELGDQRIAVEVNREIIPRSEFASHQLGEGDVVEIIQAIGGG